MNIQNETILSALNDNGFTFDGQMWFCHEGGEVLVAEGADRNDEEIRIVFADCDGVPWATVSQEDAPAMIRRVTTQEDLSWLSEYGQSAGYDVTSC